MDRDDMIREILRVLTIQNRFFDGVSGDGGVVVDGDLGRCVEALVGPVGSISFGCFAVAGFPVGSDPSVVVLCVVRVLRENLGEFDLEVVGYSHDRREVAVRYRSYQGWALADRFRCLGGRMVVLGVEVVVLDVEDPDVELIFSHQRPRLAPLFGSVSRAGRG